MLLPGPTGSLSGIHFDPDRKRVKLVEYEKQKIKEVEQPDIAHQLIIRELHSGQLPFRFKDAADTQASWQRRLPFGYFWGDAQIDWPASSAAWRPFVLTMTDAASAPSEAAPAGAAQLEIPIPEPEPSEPESAKTIPTTPAEAEASTSPQAIPKSLPPLDWLKLKYKDLKPGEKDADFARRIAPQMATAHPHEVKKPWPWRTIANNITKHRSWLAEGSDDQSSK